MGRIQSQGHLFARGVDSDAYGAEELLEGIQTGDQLRATKLIPAA